MSIEHTVERGIFGWRIIVPSHEESRAREQWRLYDIENRGFRKRLAKIAGAAGVGAGMGAIGWALVLVIVFAAQKNRAFGLNWLGEGGLQVGAVEAGEWWRAVTALTLHVDVVHLVGNIGFGTVFGVIIAREIGGGLAWLMILIGGTAGNLMNVAVQRPEHSSIGASTAVFAALGLASAYLWTAQRLLHDSWARRWAPVVGGILFLAWFGTGGERTDIVAHLTGFIAGFGLGFLLGRFQSLRESDMAHQRILGVVALACTFLAWALALSSVTR
jgi:rhomboid protease GluP